MDKVWDILGHSNYFKEITKSLIEDTNARILIGGTVGCGKSWFSKTLGTFWENQGGVCIVAEGDRIMSERAYYPLSIQTEGLKKRWKHYDKAISVMVKVIGTSLGIGAISELANFALNSKVDFKKEYIFLNQEESDFLQKISSLSKSKPILLIADNLHWWDEASLKFLLLLIRQKLHSHKSLSFLENLRIVCVKTDDDYQPACHPEILSHEIYPLFGEMTFSLKGVNSENLKSILYALGFNKTLSEEELIRIDNACGGNLAFLAKIVDYMLDSSTFKNLDSNQSTKFINNIIRERVYSIAKTGKQVYESLQCASILGTSFFDKDLACIQGKSESTIQEYIRYAKNIKLLEEIDFGAQFTHESIRNIFYEYLGDKQCDIYRKLSKCLKVSKSGEYAFRTIALEKANTKKGAIPYICSEILRRVRNRIAYNDFLNEERKELLQKNNIWDCLQAQIGAYDLISKDMGEQAIAKLKRWDVVSSLPKLLRAEKDYILSISLLNTRLSGNRKKAIDKLKKWAGYDDEIEINLRLAILLLYALMLEEDKCEAQEQLEQIETYIESNNISDNDLTPLYILYRISNGIYETDIAAGLTEEAIDYFQPHEGGISKNGIEYIKAINNHGANLICLGKYKESFSSLSIGVNYLMKNPEHSVDKGCFINHNLILSQFRLGKISAEQAFTEQYKAIQTLDANLTAIFFENNCIAYSLIAGRFEDAIELSNKMRSKIDDNENIEKFILYLVEQSECLVSFHAKKDMNAKIQWEKTQEIAMQIPYIGKDIYIQRHKNLLKAFDIIKPGKTNDWDNYFANYPIKNYTGLEWKHFGRGFLLTDLQYWRIS